MRKWTLEAPLFVRRLLLGPYGRRHVLGQLEQAAAILGCHVSNVAKLVTKGQLTPAATSKVAP